MQEEHLLTVNLAKNRPVDFFQNHILYKDNKIYYKDIDGVCYLHTITTHRVYFVPVSKTNRYSVSVRAKGVSYDFQFATGFLDGSSKSNEENFAILVNVIDKLIKPFVIINLLLEFSETFKIQLKNLTVTPEGIHIIKIGFFKNTPMFMLWEQYYTAQLQKGYLCVYQKFNNKAGNKLFFSCSMYAYNAVVMPDLLNFLAQKGGKLDASTRNELLKRKREQESQTSENEKTEETKKFCSTCGIGILKSDQKFCIQCGKRLI